MSLPDGMATEAAAENRPNFGAMDSMTTDASAPPATPDAAPDTKAPATTSPEQPDTAALSDDELANAPDEKAETKAPEAKTTDTPPANEWDEIRKEFPTLTKAELKAMQERDKNLQAGFTKKTQKLAEQRKHLDELEKATAERLGELDSSMGETALKIVRSIQADPSLQARLEKAWREVSEPDENDVQGVALKRQQYEMNKWKRDQEARIQAVEEERTAKEAAQRTASAKALADKHGIDYDWFYAAMQRKVDQLRGNHEEYDVDDLMEPVALEVKAKIESLNQKYLETWKQSKRTAAKVAPVGARGGSAAPAPKEPDLNDSESRMAMLEKLMGS